MWKYETKLPRYVKFPFFVSLLTSPLIVPLSPFVPIGNFCLLYILPSNCKTRTVPDCHSCLLTMQDNSRCCDFPEPNHSRFMSNPSARSINWQNKFPSAALIFFHFRTNTRTTKNAFPLTITERRGSLFVHTWSPSGRCAQSTIHTVHSDDVTRNQRCGLLETPRLESGLGKLLVKPDKQIGEGWGIGDLLQRKNRKIRAHVRMHGFLSCFGPHSHEVYNHPAASLCPVILPGPTTLAN